MSEVENRLRTHIAFDEGDQPYQSLGYRTPAEIYEADRSVR